MSDNQYNLPSSQNLAYQFNQGQVELELFKIEISDIAKRVLLKLKQGDLEECRYYLEIIIDKTNE